MTLQEEILQEFVEAGATRHDWSAMYERALLQVVLDGRERAREWYRFNRAYKCRRMRQYRLTTIGARREYERTPERVAAKRAYDKRNNDRPAVKACKRRYYEKRRDEERARRCDKPSAQST